MMSTALPMDSPERSGMTIATVVRTVDTGVARPGADGPEGRAAASAAVSVGWMPR